jgi:hypothetical protein
MPYITVDTSAAATRGANPTLGPLTVINRGQTNLPPMARADLRRPRVALYGVGEYVPYQFYEPEYSTVGLAGLGNGIEPNPCATQRQKIQDANRAHSAAIRAARLACDQFRRAQRAARTQTRAAAAAAARAGVPTVVPSGVPLPAQAHIAGLGGCSCGGACAACQSGLGRLGQIWWPFPGVPMWPALIGAGAIVYWWLNRRERMAPLRGRARKAVAGAA